MSPGTPVRLPQSAWGAPASLRGPVWLLTLSEGPVDSPPEGVMTQVLFIDDQIRDFLSLLKAVQHFLPEVEMLTADNGPEGIEIAFEKRPAIIFLDVSMPGMSGYDVCRELKQDERTANTPVLFLSSLDLDLSQQLEALNLGATDFLRKPIHSVELALRIRVMLRLNAYTTRLEELVSAQTRSIERQRLLAARTERLAAMGTLAAGIAHEVNQPLNALKVTADGLLYWRERNQPIDEEEVFEGLRFITDQAQRISDIVHHMRELVHQDGPGKPEPVECDEVLNRTLSLIGQQLHHHGIEVHRRMDEDLPRLLGHPTELEQVLINLLSNAMRALDRSSQSERFIDIHCEKHEDSMRIMVRDNGTGIPEESLESIFDPFFSLDPSGKGMGLGLSISQNLIQGMNGTLTVENHPEGGARFIITLPLEERT